MKNHALIEPCKTQPVHPHLTSIFSNLSTSKHGTSNTPTFQPHPLQLLLPTTTTCTIEDFYAGKQPFRVIYPGPPIWSFQLSHATDKALEIEDKLDSFATITGVLGRHNLSRANTMMRGIERKGATPFTGWKNDCETAFVIESRERDPTTWKDAAREVYEFLLSEECGFQAGEVHVEVWNSLLFHELYSYCLWDDRKILAAMQTVEPLVYETVKTVLGDSWTSIAYHMTGPRHDESRAVPTVIVYCKPGSVENFLGAQEAIAAVLNSDRHPDVALHLEILPGSTGLAAPPTKEFNPDFARYWCYKHSELNGPRNGTSIGPRKTTQSGSLGGWVSLQVESGEVMEYAMTCYHVASPGDTSNKDTNDEHGIGLNGTQPLSPITITCPSPVDDAETRKTILKNPARESMERFEETISTIGSVEYGSGNRRRTEFGSRLDWALISSPNLTNSMRNKPPIPYCYNNLNNELHEYVNTHNPSYRLLNVSDSKMAGQWVCKAGRSGSHDGIINRMYRRVKWEDGFGESMELEVLPVCESKWFCHEGDAGSWVVNAKREVVGMVIGMDEHSRGILTPLKDIMEDIERVTGNLVSLPRPRAGY